MKIEILTSPYSKGVGAGAGAGPPALLAAGLLETLRADGHEVAGPYVATASRSTDGDEMGVIESAGDVLAGLVREARAGGAFCLLLEGDCTAAPAAVAGLQGSGRVGMLWIDSHGDFNTPETTPSGMLGGMPVAVSTGRCYPDWRRAVGLAEPLREADVVLARIRDLDPPERAALEGSAVEVIESLGDAVAEQGRLSAALARLAGSVDALYTHVDVDVLNPASALGFSMKVPGGPTPEELAEMVALAARTGKLAALGIAAFVPAHDADGRTARAILHLVEAAAMATPGGLHAS